MNEVLKKLNSEELMNTSMDIFMTYGMKLFTALIVLAVGWWVIGRMMDIMDRGLNKANTEATLARFLHSIVSIFLKAILLVIFASMVGVETTSLIALLGAAGLAVGLALQGSLSNFAGGVLILFFKPFKAGDEIEAQARKEGMLTMLEDGIFKAAQGLTSVEEVLRVINE